MNEKSLTVLEQYDIEVVDTYRSRGNYGCNTKDKKYILQEYDHSNEKMISLKAIYDYLEKNDICTDYVIANRENSFVSISEDGYQYILKRWYNAQECDIKNIEHLVEASKLLGDFHQLLENTAQLFTDIKGFHPGKNMLVQLSKHNREIINIRNYIKKRKNKNEFEMTLFNIIESYNSQAKESYCLLEESSYGSLYEDAQIHKTINHGCFNHHNLMFEQETPILINLQKINYAPQIQDLYDFLRKAMEKNGWDINIGHKIIESYDKTRLITASEYKVLKSMFCYPEKFWKIINYYYNSNKAWYSEKNADKLNVFKTQEDLRWNFIRSM